MSWRFPLRKKRCNLFSVSPWFSATFTLSRCQNRLSAEGRYFGGEYGDDPFNLVSYSWHRLQAAFPAIWGVPSSISFVSSESPSASHPSSCSSLAHVRGWFMTDPFSKGPLHLFALLGSPQRMRNTQPEPSGWVLSPAINSHLLLRWHCASFPACWAVGQTHWKTRE